LGGWHLHRFGSGYRCNGLLRLHNRKQQTMTHSLYLSIIGAVVFLAAYIILRLLRDNERLILELDDAKAEARTLDTDLDEARRSNGKANAYIQQLNVKLKESKAEEDALDYFLEHATEENKKHKELIQQLYGRIGAMQRQINRLKNQK
jgi:uncharacterized membrane protein YhiD involved in acid resistance